MSGVPNANGIYEVRVFDGNKKIGGFAIDRIGYDETRYLNAHIDYRTKLSGGAYFQHLFPLEGDKLEIYPERSGANAIVLDDTLVHAIRVEVRDPYGNLSVARMQIRRAGARKAAAPLPHPVMKPGMVNVFENDDVQVMVPELSLYDSIGFRYSAQAGPVPLGFSKRFSLDRYTVPVHLAYTVRIKPDKPIPYPLRDRMLAVMRVKDETEVRKAHWELGWYAAKFRDFGEVQLVADDSPPVITVPGLAEGGSARGLQRITVTVGDNFNSIRNFRAELDGRWLMFSQRGRTFTYKMDARMTPGAHTLVLRVDDEAGNQAVKTIRFTR
jgi:hypothetical protein